MQIEIEHNAMTFSLTSKKESVIKEWLLEMSQLVMSENATGYTRIRIYPTNKAEEEWMKGRRAQNLNLDPKGLREIGDMFHAFSYTRQEQLKKNGM
jgi:hypothetical protein